MKRLAPLLILLTISPLAFSHGMTDPDQLKAANGGFIDFIELGAGHMITGYDHLLFLFGVMFFLTKFKDIVKFVTAFTLGHSITLIGATFIGYRADYFLIDAVIALTVCYKGFDNLGGFKKYFDMKSPNLIAMVFIFGLIHGLGLSTRLQTITIGEGMDLLGKIIAFNIGVEAGQVFALIIMLLLLASIRHTKSFQRFSTAANASLIIIGGLLMLMQLHGYSHENAKATEFFNEAAHEHQHEGMAMSAGGQNNGNIPSGYHVDAPGGTPHKDHGDNGEQGHSHGVADKFDPLVTQIFETRKQYKSANTDEEVLKALNVLPEIYQDLVLLRELVAPITYMNFAKIDAFLEVANVSSQGIQEEDQQNNATIARQLISKFEESLLEIEELVNHPVIPENYQGDTSNTGAEGGHSHGDADIFGPVVTRIFEVRKHYKSANTNEEVLAVHTPVSKVYQDLVLLRKMLVAIPYLDFKQIDAYQKEAGDIVNDIKNETKEGNADNIRGLIKRFDTCVLEIEELVNHPVLPGGYHVDEPGGKPHKH